MYITIYSKTHCPRCVATTRALSATGRQYDIINVEEDQDALDYIKRRGHAEAPVVILTNRNGDILNESSGGLLTKDEVEAFMDY